MNSNTDIIFVHFGVSYKFADDRSRYVFDSAYQSFRNRHRRDAQQEYSYGYDLPALKSRMTFYVGDEPKNYMCGLVVWSILGCLWPYSISVEKNVSRFNVDFMKVLTM